MHDKIPVYTYGRLAVIFTYGIETWLSTDSNHNIGWIKLRRCG